MLLKTRRLEIELSFGSVFLEVHAFGRICALHWDRAADLRSIDWMLPIPAHVSESAFR